MVLFANIGIFIGVYLVGPLVSVFLGRFGAAVIAFAGIPIYAHNSIKVGYVRTLITFLRNSEFIVAVHFRTGSDTVAVSICLLLCAYVARYRCVVRSISNGFNGICHWVVFPRPRFTRYSKV